MDDALIEKEGPEITDPAERRSNGKATLALVLAVLALVSILVFALGHLLDAGWIEGNVWVWFILLCIGMGGGAVAAFTGALGWIDVRRGVTEDGLRQAQIGSILGGVVAAGIVVTFVVLMVVFIYVVSSFSTG